MELGFSCLLESLQFILLKRSDLFRFFGYGECFPVVFPIFIFLRARRRIEFLCTTKKLNAEKLQQNQKNRSELAKDRDISITNNEISCLCNTYCNSHHLSLGSGGHSIWLGYSRAVFVMVIAIVLYALLTRASDRLRHRKSSPQITHAHTPTKYAGTEERSVWDRNCIFFPFT